MPTASIPRRGGPKTRVRRFWRAVTIADNMISRHSCGGLCVGGSVEYSKGQGKYLDLDIVNK